MKKAVNFFLFTSLYIAVCAALMAYQTFLLFHYPVQYKLVGFIFFGTICSYNFHWYLTPALAGGSVKTQWSAQNRSLHLALLLIGLLGAAWFGWQLIDRWYWLLLTAFVTFLYSAPKIPFKPFISLRKIAIGKTVFLALAWTHIPFILPLLFSTSIWSNAAYLFVFNRFYLIYAICIVFDYRDREADRHEGIRSMVTHLPDTAVNRLFWGALFVFFASSCLSYFQGLNLWQVSLLLLPGIILAGLYSYSKRHSSDYYYYFVLDGLMMLSSLLLLILPFP
ncbi:MAG: hypothetical protein JWP88_957 [Flaviaesturariibacter sp.]|nr:hypothetical protein [Flaviaesturariibacter sp.]